MEALGGGIVSFTQFWDDAHSGLFPALCVALDWVQQFLLPCSSGQFCILYTGDQVR